MQCLLMLYNHQGILGNLLWVQKIALSVPYFCVYIKHTTYYSALCSLFYEAKTPTAFIFWWIVYRKWFRVVQHLAWHTAFRVTVTHIVLSKMYSFWVIPMCTFSTEKDTKVSNDKERIPESVLFCLINLWLYYTEWEIGSLCTIPWSTTG